MTRIINSYDPYLMALDKVPGVKFVELIGSNSDIDTATVPESVWPVGGAYSFRTSAAVVELISDSAQDDPVTAGPGVGTGAWTVTVEGLDADYKEISETITLNGTAAVAGSLLFFRINAAYVNTFGSGGTNAGNITIRDASAGTTRSYITAAHGRAEVGIYTVPADSTMLLAGWYVTARDASGVSDADIDFKERHNAIAGAWHVAWSVTVDKVFASPFFIPHVFPEKTDIDLSVTLVGANNTVVRYHGHGLLFGPNAA